MLNKLSICQRGFTLIELMIVVAVVGILASIAYPSYQSSVVKTRRVDVQRELLSYSQSMERYYTANGRYVTLTGGNVCGATLPVNTGFYTFQASNCADNTFTVTATPVNTSSQNNDGTQTLNHQGIRGGSVNSGNWAK